MFWVAVKGLPLRTWGQLRWPLLQLVIAGYFWTPRGGQVVAGLGLKGHSAKKQTDAVPATAGSCWLQLDLPFHTQGVAGTHITCRGREHQHGMGR